MTTLSTRLWKLPKSTSKKQNIYNILLNRDIHFTCILCLLNNTCVKHNFKSVHVSNLFWSREYNSAKEMCKYASFSKVGGNYPLDLKIIWSSALNYLTVILVVILIMLMWKAPKVSEHFVSRVLSFFNFSMFGLIIGSVLRCPNYMTHHCKRDYLKDPHKR